MILSAQLDGGNRVFAAVDPSVRFTKGEVRGSRLGALLAPFKTEIEARAALLEAGAQIEEVR